MPVTRVGSVERENTSPHLPFTVELPAGIQAGDLIFYFMQVSAVGAFIDGDTGPKRWWSIFKGAVNSRQVAILARVYNPGDPASDYELTLKAQGTARYITVAIRGHDVGAFGDLVIGTIWTRPANGGSQSIVRAPGIASASNRKYAIAFMGEASTQVSPWVQTEGDFTTWVDYKENETGTRIEYLTVLDKVLSPPEASGDLVFSYAPASSLNGIGVQIAIPEGSSETPSVGLIRNMGSLSPDVDTITAASKYDGELTVEAMILDDQEVELLRLPISYDSVTKWGHVTFDELNPGQTYTVRYIVDGVIQTDVWLETKTLPATSDSFVFVTGSCNITGSVHQVWNRILDENPAFLSHQGDWHYLDATTDTQWREGMEALFNTGDPFKNLARKIPIEWKPDNHDRIITNPAGDPDLGLNYGETDPRTQEQWKHLAGDSDWATSDTLGRAWRIGRVLFVHTDMWSARDDGDGDPAPRTFLGPGQKQWFKDTLESATDSALIVWFSQWTARNHTNGRWNSYPEETSELEAWINARPDIKRKLVMLGGDSHSLQADDGSRTGTQYRFHGIPSLNISGFNKSSPTNDGSAGWSIANEALRTEADPEYQWGSYAKVTITDNGEELRFKWEGIRVNNAGVTDTMAWFERSFGQDYKLENADALYSGPTLLWRKDVAGTP